MAIGTWETQNKVRPGVYINYVFSEAELINYASEGVLAINYTLPLNPEAVVEISSADVKAKNLNKYGVVQGTDAYKYITTLLKYCSKLVLYSPKVNDASKARLIVSNEFTATAKYPGKEGNKIAIEIIGETDKVFNTYYNDELVAMQTLFNGTSELVGDNEFVTIEITGSVTTSVPTLLTGGADGTVNAGSFTSEFLDKLKTKEIEVLAVNLSEDEYDFSIIQNFIEDYNANHVQKVVVVYPLTGDVVITRNSEFIIALANQTATLSNGLVMDNKLLAGYIGAKEAGADHTVDLTYNLCDDIIEISELTNEQIETNIKQGVMNLSLRSDRSVVIEDDINTLILLSDNQSSSLKSNDTLRLLNDLSYKIVSFGENIVIGKKKATETTLNLVKAQIIEIMNNYAKEQVIVNFDSNNDVSVVFGEQKDGILCTIAIQKTQSAKKLYFSIGVR